MQSKNLHVLHNTLSPSLFWDVDFDSIDFDSYPSFVIERVAQHGTLKEWNAITDYYGRNKVKYALINARYLPKRDMLFFSTYFNIPPDSFRCSSTPQSIQQLWPV
jgi:hypothetical protein